MKLTYGQKGMLIFTIGLLGMGGFGAALIYMLDHKEDYIVTAKGGNKITYRDISNSHNLHEMTFDGDTVFPEGGWYPYINVGDTIRGTARLMNRSSIMSVGFMPRFGYNVHIIHSVNGRNLQNAQEKARRDSIMLEMKTKQKGK